MVSFFVMYKDYFATRKKKINWFNQLHTVITEKETTENNTI